MTTEPVGSRPLVRERIRRVVDYCAKLGRRLHKYMLEIEHISVISDEVRTVVEEEWPELAHKLPPKSQH